MFTLLFTGLPIDVRTTEVSELLAAPPLLLNPASFSIQAYYAASGAFTGTMLLELQTERDAEAVRQQFSGQVIDGSYKLAVHHVLAPHLALPGATQHRFTTPAAPAAPPAFPAQALGARVRPVAKQQQQQQLQAPAKAATARPKHAGNQPEGLKLLARLKGKPGEQDKQKALLERQRAALKKAPGDALLSRLAGPKGGPASAAAATKKARQAAANAAAKVGRAKRASQMDIDPPAGGAGGAKAKSHVQQAKAKVEPAPKAKPKTQADLDEEMKAYERARRFT
ncbi:hypothetical protein Q5752_005140 [Cryptotrichosporon argae]